MFPLEHITPLIDYRFNRLEQAGIFIRHDDPFTVTEELTDWIGLSIQSNGHMTTFGERLNYDADKFLIPIRKIDYANIFMRVSCNLGINYPYGDGGANASSWREFKLVNYRYDTQTFSTFKQYFDRPFNIEGPSATTLATQERKTLSFETYRNVALNPNYFWGIGLAMKLFPGDVVTRVCLAVDFQIE